MFFLFSSQRLFVNSQTSDQRAYYWRNARNDPINPGFDQLCDTKIIKGLYFLSFRLSGPGIVNATVNMCQLTQVETWLFLQVKIFIDFFPATLIRVSKSESAGRTEEMAGDLNISMTRGEPFEFPAMAQSRLAPWRAVAAKARKPPLTQLFGEKVLQYILAVMISKFFQKRPKDCWCCKRNTS